MDIALVEKIENSDSLTDSAEDFDWRDFPTVEDTSLANNYEKNISVIVNETKPIPSRRDSLNMLFPGALEEFDSKEIIVTEENSQDSGLNEFSNFLLSLLDETVVSRRTFNTVLVGIAIMLNVSIPVEAQEGLSIPREIDIDIEEEIINMREIGDFLYIAARMLEANRDMKGLAFVSPRPYTDTELAEGNSSYFPLYGISYFNQGEFVTETSLIVLQFRDGYYLPLVMAGNDFENIPNYSEAAELMLLTEQSSHLNMGTTPYPQNYSEHYQITASRNIQMNSYTEETIEFFRSKGIELERTIINTGRFQLNSNEVKSPYEGTNPRINILASEEGIKPESPFYSILQFRHRDYHPDSSLDVNTMTADKKVSLINSIFNGVINNDPDLLQIRLYEYDSRNRNKIGEEITNNLTNQFAGGTLTIGGRRVILKGNEFRAVSILLNSLLQNGENLSEDIFLEQSECTFTPDEAIANLLSEPAYPHASHAIPWSMRGDIESQIANSPQGTTMFTPIGYQGRVTVEVLERSDEDQYYRYVLRGPAFAFRSGWSFTIGAYNDQGEYEIIDAAPLEGGVHGTVVINEALNTLTNRGYTGFTVSLNDANRAQNILSFRENVIYNDNDPVEEVHSGSFPSTAFRSGHDPLEYTDIEQLTNLVEYYGNLKYHILLLMSLGSVDPTYNSIDGPVREVLNTVFSSNPRSN
ncbi:MAG: hypothetical protein Q9M91_01825 [Candidatus Dojkabacteria bacterium]|nr:hypothetical protein [Candidatus Dojkabacteria bacterium]MDQ7020563.1 hypothetical protein [Candidatus Dojkabacteria bacterium]